MLGIGLGAERGEGTNMKLLMAAAAVAALSFGAAAHATTYDLGPLVPGKTSATKTITHKNTTGASATFSDTFDFTIAESYNDYTSAAINLGGKYQVTDIDLTLYKVGDATAIASMSYDPQTAPAGTLAADLSAGSYYLTSMITVPKSDTGSYTLAATVSSAPEPGTWVLMFAGVGLAGGMLRYNRRNNGAMAAAA